jgi:hypothetical protein
MVHAAEGRNQPVAGTTAEPAFCAAVVATRPSYAARLV